VKVIDTKLPGVILFQPRLFGDSRGFFVETWHRDRYREAGIAEEFVQDNLSFSARGVLRGLHFQNPSAQGKLVQVLAGEVFDVAVDIRRGSPHYGEWLGVTLSAEEHNQLYVPPGFAHGFCVTSETALFNYKCSDFYNPAAERSIRWDDPAIGVDWPLTDLAPELSVKDRQAPRLAGLDEEVLPRYE